MPIRNYETKLTHFVYFSDFDKDIRDEINDAETWDNHSIREYSKYYPELEMVNVYVHIA